MPIKSFPPSEYTGGGGGGDNLGNHTATTDLDMGANDITNVGNVDGRDVSADGAALDSHLDGTAGKHDASEIDVEGTYANISGTPTDLESTISAIDSALTSTFLDLTDTPSSYTGEAGKYPVVNEAEDALEFIEVPNAALGGYQEIVIDDQPASNQDNTNTSYAALTGVAQTSFTTPVSGTHLFEYKTAGYSVSGDFAANHRLVIDKGTAYELIIGDADQWRAVHLVSSGSDHHYASFFGEAALASGTHTIDVEVKLSAAGTLRRNGNDTSQVLIQAQGSGINGLEVLEETLSSPYTVTGTNPSPAQITGFDIDVNTLEGEYIELKLSGSAQLSTSGTNDLTIHYQVDSGTVTECFYELDRQTNTFQGIHLNRFIGPLSAGQHSIKLLAGKSAGTIVILTGAVMQVIRYKSFGIGAGTIVTEDEIASTYSLPADTNWHDTGHEVTINTIENERVFLELAAHVNTVATTFPNFQIRFDIDGTTYSDAFYSNLIGTASTDWRVPINIPWTTPELTSGEHTIKVQVRQTNAGNLISIRHDYGNSFKATQHRGGLIPIQKDGATIVEKPSAINFTGSLFDVTQEGSVATVDIGFKSYLDDANLQALWKMDEVEDNAYLYDYSDNEYDLTNYGFQELHPWSMFGYGSRPDGLSDYADTLLSTATNLQITGDLTIEGMVVFEDLTAVNKVLWNVGHDVYNNQYGVCLYQDGTNLVWKVCTTSGVYTASIAISGNFELSKAYFIRCTFDAAADEIAIWSQYLSSSVNLGDYPEHIIDDFGTLTELVNTSSVTGTISYNTGSYDRVSLGGAINTNTSTWNYFFKGVFDHITISDVIRTGEYLTRNGLIPNKDGLYNLGSRFRRFDSIHAVRIFGELGQDVVKDHSIDWGTGSFQVNSGDVPNDVTDFDGLLSASDTTVLSALETIDDIDATDIPAVTTSFDGLLSGTEDTVQKALDVLDDLDADTLSTDTTDFDGLLSGSDTDVQTALETLDEVDWLELPDTPSSFSSQAGKVPAVNSGETALEFVGQLDVEDASRSIYIDHDTGSDSNGGASWGDAFETLQAGIDDIRNVILDGVTITVYCRGEFDEGPEEGICCDISKLCVGSGNIVVRADDYKGLTNVTSATSSTLVFAGTYATDYWKDCYVWLTHATGGGTGIGQARKITASSSSAGSTTLTVTPNWTTTPDATTDFCIAGRARLHQPASAGHWLGIYIHGPTLRCTVAGFAAYDYDVGESVPFQVADYAYNPNQYCIGYSNGASNNADFYATNYAAQNNVWCASVDSGNHGFQVFRFAKLNANRCICTGFTNDGIHAEQLSFSYQFRSYFSGGTNSCNIIQSAFQNRDAYGTDGSARGIFLQDFSTIRQVGSTALTVEGANDLDTDSISLLPKRTSASAQPTPETSEVRIWRDPDDNKTYIIYNDPDEGVRKVEMT